jgi:transcriptional regulator with XRE-family HTH domain
MELREWLRAKGLTQESLAKDLNVSQPAVSRWCNGERPSPELLEALYLITKGCVTAKDFEHQPNKDEEG